MTAHQTSVHGWAYYNVIDPCRCDICRAHHAARLRAYRAKRRMTNPVSPRQQQAPDTRPGRTILPGQIAGTTTNGTRFAAKYKLTEARRDHRCDTCPLTISRGSVYALVNGFMTYRVCSKCMRAAA